MCAAPFIAAARNSPGFPDFYEHERAGIAAAKERDVHAYHSSDLQHAG